MLPEEILKPRETLPVYCCFMFPLISLQEAKGTRTIYFEVQNMETMVWHCLTVVFYNCQARLLRISYSDFSDALNPSTTISPFG